MALKLYRRHRIECEGGHLEDARTGEFEEGRRGWKRCGCLIHVAGTLGGKFSRKQTSKALWDEAKAVAAEFEKSGSLDGEVVLAEPLPQPAQPRRIAVEHAVTAFLRELQETAAFATHKKYRLLLTKFKEFSIQRGYAFIDQWEPTDVRDFRTSWAINPQTGARCMAMLKPFFEYCLANEWITRNPARLVKNPRGRDAGEKRAEQKLPFTDDELKRMYTACPKYGTSGKYKWTGDDLADFISLSIYTGLRISDVALFHIDRMQTTRRNPLAHDQGRNARLYMGAAMASGPNTRAGPRCTANLSSVRTKPKTSTSSRISGAGS
jgi:hypothetical protein